MSKMPGNISRSMQRWLDDAQKELDSWHTTLAIIEWVFVSVQVIGVYSCGYRFTELRRFAMNMWDFLNEHIVVILTTIIVLMILWRTL